MLPTRIVFKFYLKLKIICYTFINLNIFVLKKKNDKIYYFNVKYYVFKVPELCFLFI